MLSTRRIRQDEAGVRIVNCARGELIDEEALTASDAIGQGGRRGPGRFRKRTAAA